MVCIGKIVPLGLLFCLGLTVATLQPEETSSSISPAMSVINIVTPIVEQITDPGRAGILYHLFVSVGKSVNNERTRPDKKCRHGYATNATLASVAHPWGVRAHDFLCKPKGHDKT